MSTHKQFPKARLTQKTVELPSRSASCDEAETSPTVQVEMRRSSRDVSDSIQRQSGGFQLYNREQTTDAAGAVPEREAKANPSPESSEEYRDFTVTACTGNDAIRNQEHDAGKDLRRARYSQSGCCQDCQRNRQSFEHRMSPV